MNDSSTHELKNLKQELARIDRGGKEECTMCRLVLILAFVVLFLVMIFVFFFRLNKEPALKPLPPELTPLIDPAREHQQILELGHTLHPELSTLPQAPLPHPSTPLLAQPK